MSRGYLLVRVGGREFGLPISRVLEVADTTEVLDVPRRTPALRGLTPARGRLVPLVHLGALLGGRAAPPERGRSHVLVALSGARVAALEVDDADEVVRDDPLPVPAGQDLPWAGGVARRGDAVVPVLDLAALEERFE
jgi:chemotaxis signal transduction protein